MGSDRDMEDHQGRADPGLRRAVDMVRSALDLPKGTSPSKVAAAAVARLNPDQARGKGGLVQGICTCVRGGEKCDYCKLPTRTEALAAAQARQAAAERARAAADPSRLDAAAGIIAHHLSRDRSVVVMVASEDEIDALSAPLVGGDRKVDVHACLGAERHPRLVPSFLGRAVLALARARVVVLLPFFLDLTAVDLSAAEVVVLVDPPRDPRAMAMLRGRFDRQGRTAPLIIETVTT